MKALKLADEFRLSMTHEVMASWGSDSAIELRRLAEVNAELLKAINDLSVTAESTKPGEFSVASHALFALQAAANKAKEQQ